MSDYIFGANILENLTIGMYQDSKIIYREYIQNSCDQIDKAVKQGILKPEDGYIHIWLYPDKRTIHIEDNATGISSNLFRQTLGNIADSNKKIGIDKGFRGIGRLCGLAYCKQLVFTSSAQGEDVISKMTCDAKKMRDLLIDNQNGKKLTANEVLQIINTFDQEKTNNVDSHFFYVDLIDINQENTDLLDFKQVKDYLSFVAPVDYQNCFYYRDNIIKHSKEIHANIDNYNITLNGEPIFKRYATILKDTNLIKYDDIFDTIFNDFYNSKGELIAWIWVGISKFQKAIPKINQMRGIRLRKGNIQIGDEDTLQKLFKEDRGNNYFIGEVFAIDNDLIPNSQRDYFNENLAQKYFEIELKKYFNEQLYKLYRDGSTINSSYKKIESYEKKLLEFKEKENSVLFIDEKHFERENKELILLEQKAKVAQQQIDKIKERSENELTQKIIIRIEDEKKQAANITKETPIETDKKPDTNLGHRADKLSQFNRKERKLISKIYSIIINSTDNETAEIIINKIEQEL